MVKQVASPTIPQSTHNMTTRSRNSQSNEGRGAHLIRLIPDQSLSFCVYSFPIVVSIFTICSLFLFLLTMLCVHFCISLPFSLMKSHWNRRRNHCFHFPRFFFLNVVRQVEQEQTWHNYYNGVICINIQEERENSN